MTADREARARALDAGRSFIVQAPAGSGKTELLTQRFLKLLARVERPERVLAITFTRKATQEMRSRITTRLAQAQAGTRPEAQHEQQAVAFAAEVLERDRERGWRLLESAGRLRINTIDGLCTQLLARDPVLGPRWSDRPVLDHAEPLYREAVRRVFHDIDELVARGSEDAGAARDAIVELLVHLGGDSRRLEKLMVKMLKQRALWRRHLLTDHEMLDVLLEARQAQALESFRTALGDASLDEAAELTARLGFDLDWPGADSESALGAAHRLAGLLTTAGNKPRKPGGISRRLFPDLSTPGEAALERLREIYAQWHGDEAACEALERMAAWPPLQDTPVHGADSRALLDAARAVLSLALAELDALMAERGVSDFTAVSEAALTCLGSDTQPADLLLAEDARIDHILMDEFQDTSHAQYQLIERLTAGWQPGDGRTLFLVGDPMQSIYRFREANVGFFNELVKQGRLGQVPVEPLTLKSNFRSNLELIDWFNATFPAVFPPRDESDSGAVAYTAVSAERASGGQVQLLAVDASDPENDQVACIAAAIAQAREALDDPSIAILVRARDQASPIVAGLRRRGIEVETVDIGRLVSSGVVRDLLVLSRALVHPLDRVAWIALLRAPWCGLTIPEIHRVVGDDPMKPVSEAVGDAVDAGLLQGEAQGRLDRLHRVMVHARQFGHGLPLAERVEACWTRLGGPLCCADGSDFENAHAFLALLEELGLEGERELVERLEEALETRFAASRPARVQIMTIHKAKGLEFDVVIVPGLERSIRGPRESLIALQEFSGADGGSGVLMAPLTTRSMAEVSLYGYLNRVDAERNRFESQRVLYVACTRARTRLHLVAAASATAKGSPSIKANSFLKLLEAPFKERLEAVIERSARLGESNEGRREPPPAVALVRLQGPLPEPELPVEAAEATSLRKLPRREAAALGTVLHRWLELIHDHPEPAWDAARIEHSTASIRDSLARAGAPPESLDELQAQCVAVLSAALGDAELMAAVGPQRRGASWSELALYRREGEGFSRHVIDLLLRDDDGALRIIDYKTGTGDDLDNEAWQAQLERYRALVDSLGAGRVSEVRIRILERDRGSIEAG